jgi:hypothetical protein
MSNFRRPRARAGSSCGKRGVRLRHVFGPLSSLGICSRTFRVGLVMARCSTSGYVAAPRSHLGPGLPLPSGDHRAGCGNAVRNVSRPVLAGLGERSTVERGGLPWPEKAERNARLSECASIVKTLLAGETVSHSGRVTVIDARLYSLPKPRPLVLGAAVSEATAELVGGWADDLLTVNARPEQVRKVVEAFYRGGGEGKPF